MEFDIGDPPLTSYGIFHNFFVIFLNEALKKKCNNCYTRVWPPLILTGEFKDPYLDINYKSIIQFE